jgi:hypothetical protein
MAYDLGTDVSTFPDLDVTGRKITGARVVAECCLRRLTTQADTLGYDPDFGYDLRDLLNEDFSDSELRRHEARAAIEVEKDERIRRADVTLTLNHATHTLTVRITGTLISDRDFLLTLGIGQLSAEVLQVA